MSDRVIAEVVLGAHNRPTGKTVHWVDGAPAAATARLRIVQLAGDDGYYLVHYDDESQEIADTYHESVVDAMEQAEFEFNIAREDWRCFSN